MSAAIDLDNATKGATAFSGIAIWGGVKGSGCRDIADACLAWLAWLATRALVGRRYRRRCGMTKPDPSTDGSQTKAGGKGLIALPVKLPHRPVVLEEQERPAADIQRRSG